MADLSARQWPRFEYEAEVRLAWPEMSATPAQVLAARCLNLSRGGMQVRTLDTPPAIGTALTCELTAAGHDTLLHGEIRWCNATDGAHGTRDLGIEFGSMSVAQHETLTRLLTAIAHGGDRVRLRGPLRGAPLDVRALPCPGGMRLRVSLACFEPGTAVEFEVGQPPTRLSGRVARTKAADGRAIDVFVEGASVQRSRRYTMYEAPRASLSRRPSGSACAPRPRRATLSMPKRRSRRGVYWVISGALVCTALLALHVAGDRPSIADPADAAKIDTGSSPRDETLLDASGPHQGRPSRPTAASAMQALLPSAAKGSAAVLPAAQVAAPTEPLQPARAPTLAAQTASSSPEQTPELAAPQAPRTAIAAAGSTTPAASSGVDAVDSDVGRRPTLHVTGDVSEVWVPLRGSLAGLQLTVWSDPLALVLDLPQAQIALPRSRYALHRGGIEHLSIGRNPSGVTQLRLLLNTLLADYSALPDGDGVVIRMKRDLRPLPQH